MSLPSALPVSLLVTVMVIGCSDGEPLTDTGAGSDGTLPVDAGADAQPRDGAMPDTVPAQCSPQYPDGPCPGERVCTVGACIVDLDPKQPIKDRRQVNELLDTIWTFYDQSYGAFPAKPKLDWAAVKTAYEPQVNAASTQFEAAWTLVRMVAEIQDGHTYALNKDHCNQSGYWGNPYSNVGACVTSSGKGGLYVYRLGASNPAGFALGDQLISIDGRDVEALLRDLEHQPRCTIHASTEAMLQAQLENGLLFRAPKDAEARVLRGGKELDLTLAPSFDPQQMIGCDGRVGVAQTTKHAWGIRSKTLASNVLYVYLPLFIAYDQQGNVVVDPLIDELRKVFVDAPSHKGVILDLRDNGGGAPQVYMALASWLYKQPTTLFYCHNKSGTGHSDHAAKWPMTTTPDPTLHYDGPLAVLVSATTFSAGDFSSHFLQATGRAKTFGAASGGGFGSGNAKKLDESWSLGFNDILCVDLQGKPLEGHPTAPDFPVTYDPADLAKGVDTMIEQALAWVQTQ